MWVRFPVPVLLQHVADGADHGFRVFKRNAMPAVLVDDLAAVCNAGEPILVKSEPHWSKCIQLLLLLPRDEAGQDAGTHRGDENDRNARWNFGMSSLGEAGLDIFPFLIMAVCMRRIARLFPINECFRGR